MIEKCVILFCSYIQLISGETLEMIALFRWYFWDLTVLRIRKISSIFLPFLVEQLLPFNLNLFGMISSEVACWYLYTNLGGPHLRSKPGRQSFVAEVVTGSKLGQLAWWTRVEKTLILCKKMNFFQKKFSWLYDKVLYLFDKSGVAMIFILAFNIIVVLTYRKVHLPYYMA